MNPMGSFSNSFPGEGVACPEEFRKLGYVIIGKYAILGYLDDN